MHNKPTSVKDKALMAISDSAAKADELRPGWNLDAAEAFSSIPMDTFQTEHVREWAYSNGLETPPSERAWGAPTILAKKLGYIEFVGYAAAKHGLSHGMPTRVWRKLKQAA